jgi:hypothetical protein
MVLIPILKLFQSKQACLPIIILFQCFWCVGWCYCQCFPVITMSWDFGLNLRGTLTWGSKPTHITLNAWGSSSILSTKNDGSSSSPSHLNGRPSSGGGSRPSTAGSESLGSPNAWGPNSRPSSASGTFPSSHLPITTNRPRSAETGPGSSQLSRFADNASENVKVSIKTIDRLVILQTLNIIRIEIQLAFQFMFVVLTCRVLHHMGMGLL